MPEPQFHHTAVYWRKRNMSGQYLVTEKEAKEFKDEARRNFPEISKDASITITDDSFDEEKDITFYVAFWPWEDDYRTSLYPDDDTELDACVEYFAPYTVFRDGSMGEGC